MLTENERAEVKKHIGVSVSSRAVEDLESGDLRGQKEKLYRATRDLLNTASKSSRDLSDSESRAFDSAMEYHDELADELRDRVDGDTPIDQSFGGKVVTPMMGGGNTYRELFGEPARSTAGFRNMGEMINAIKSGDNDALRQLRNMSGSVGTEGGFAVPEIWWSQIWNSGLEKSVALNKCTIFKMTSNVLNIAAWDSEDHSNGPIANVAGSWLGELDTATRVTPKTRLIKFDAHKLGIYVGISSEATEDSAALTKSVAPMMTSSLAFTLDSAILNGSGVARPAGILNCGATIAHGRATANSLAFADFKNMLGRLLPTSLGRAIWIVSPSAFALLVGLEVITSTGHLAMSSTPGAGKLNMELLGHPVRVSEKLPALGSKGDVMLVDFSYYGLGLRSGGRYETTRSANWSQDTQDSRLLLRADGAGLVNSPMTPSGGGSTLSPFVVLDE